MKSVAVKVVDHVELVKDPPSEESIVSLYHLPPALQRIRRSCSESLHRIQKNRSDLNTVYSNLWNLAYRVYG